MAAEREPIEAPLPPDDPNHKEKNLLELQPTASHSEPYSIFTRNQIRYIVVTASWAGLFSPISANIYFPALNTLADNLHVSSALINLTVTSYMIFQGIAPTFVGDFADVAGRRPAYVVCFILYTAANIGLALQTNFAALFVLRCLQSSGSSATIALSSGVVSDVATAAERGTYMGLVTAGSLLGPSLGPVAGGLLAQYNGWRAIFWFLTIMAAVFMVPFLLFFPETARRIVGNGSNPPQKWNVSIMNYIKSRQEAKAGIVLDSIPPNKQKLRFPNPLRTLRILLEKDTALLLYVNAILFAGYYDITASMPSLFADIYGYDDLQIGLCYLPIGVGCAMAAFTNGWTLDRNYRRIAHKLGFPIVRNRQADLRTFPIEKARVQVMVPPLVVGCAATIAFGWVLQFQSHVAAPLIILFFCGLNLTMAFNTVSTLLIDSYPNRAATATAANNLCRCLIGAGATALIVPMIDGMGKGWCFTFIGLVMLISSTPLVAVVRWGPKWREERRVREEAAAAERAIANRA